jgi:hypothetical protein
MKTPSIYISVYSPFLTSFLSSVNTNIHSGVAVRLQVLAVGVLQCCTISSSLGLQWSQDRHNRANQRLDIHLQASVAATYLSRLLILRFLNVGDVIVSHDDDSWKEYLHIDSNSCFKIGL